MVGWHHKFNGHELGQITGDGELGPSWCHSQWGCKGVQTWLLQAQTTTNPSDCDCDYSETAKVNQMGVYRV